MRRLLLQSKIHRATITSIDLHYEGSLTLNAHNHILRPRPRPRIRPPLWAES